MSVKNFVIAGAFRDVSLVSVAGGEIAVRRIESGGSKGARPSTLVFLHEGLGCIGMWKDFPDALAVATGCPALVYDRFGHGGSSPEVRDRDLGFFESEAREVLPALLSACGVEDAVLIGHSDGGTIALLHAGIAPVRGVVTEAAHVFVDEVSVAGMAAAKRAWREEGLQERLGRYHGDGTAAMFAAWSKMWSADWFFDWNIETSLPAITCPLLAIQGRDDEYGTEAQVSAIVKGVSGPVDSLIVPDCGHAPHIQAREVVLKRMTDFIRSLLD
jgi:pimeloyl-ACP methyl ester carboxylesterase